MGFESLDHSERGWSRRLDIGPHFRVNHKCSALDVFQAFRQGPQTLDLVAIHKDLFGKWVGNAFNILFILYFIMISIILIRTYLEVIQVWMFPGVNVLMLINHHSNSRV